MKKLLTALLCFLRFMCQAQSQGNVWAFGVNAGLDFNSGSSIPIQTAINTSEGCASVCDAGGQLLFYTEGSYIWDRLGNLMPDGSNLTGLNTSGSVTASTTQGAVILPMRDSANKYYVFSLTETEQGATAGRLYYSVVDMNLNSGFGDVVANRKGILVDTKLTEKMTAVVGDRCDVWLVVASANPAEFKAYEITDAGINLTPVISSTTFPINVFNVIKFSPDRRKLAVCSGLQLYDFDPATGIISNGVLLDNKNYYGACFSPDNSKLYATPVFNPDNQVYQFDLTVGSVSAVSASKAAIGVCESDLKIGPDNKIYFATDNTHLGVINVPNQAGAACQYLASAITLLNGDQNGSGIPNNLAIFIRDTANAVKHNVTVCFKDSTIIYANDSGWNYLWDDGSTETYRTVYQSGNYVVHYYTAPCTYHTDTFAVNFSSLIPLTGSLSGCYGEHNDWAWVQPQTGDVTTYTYTWTDTLGVLLQPAATSSIIADTLYNQYPGTYLVSLQGANGCDTSIRVTIDSPAYAGFIHVSDTGMCPHDTIMLHAVGSVTYHWLPDSKTYISDTSIADPKVSPPTDWSYLVYGSNTSGCLDTAIAHVRVFPNPVIKLPDSVTLYYGESYQFNPGTNCLTFNWFPPYGLNADNISNPVTAPDVNTKYIVTGTTEEGCTIKDSVNVFRSGDVILTLPNAFTPGNGPDNLFKPIHEGNVILDYLRIFNRWGQLVYESNDINQGWDGTWHGTPQPKGVYVYEMEGRTAADKIISKHGNVTLLK